MTLHDFPNSKTCSVHVLAEVSKFAFHLSYQ